MAYRKDKFYVGQVVQVHPDYQGFSNIKKLLGGAYKIVKIYDRPYEKGWDGNGSNWDSMGHTQHVILEGFEKHDYNGSENEWSGAYFELHPNYNIWNSRCVPKEAPETNVTAPTTEKETKMARNMYMMGGNKINLQEQLVVIDHVGYEIVIHKHILQAIGAMANNNLKIDAIKMVRALYNFGLKDSKDLVMWIGNTYKAQREQYVPPIQGLDVASKEGDFVGFTIMNVDEFLRTGKLVASGSEPESLGDILQAALMKGRKARGEE